VLWPRTLSQDQAQGQGLGTQGQGRGQGHSFFLEAPRERGQVLELGQTGHTIDTKA